MNLHAFTGEVLETICQYRMLDKSDKILMGVSGGPDSIAMARVLISLKQSKEKPKSLGIAHLNHNLRGEESARDEAFVKAFARDHKLPLFVESVHVGELARKNKLSMEEAGRNARYDFFSRIATANGYTKIATGHNWDDHTELVLMNLLRGAGPKGLSGIPPVRENRFIRPLINISKFRILAFLRENNQLFVQDSSNLDPAFLRNRVRHSLIPFLEKEFNPDIRTGMDRLSKILGQEDSYLTRQAGKAYETCKTGQEKTLITLSLKALSCLDPAIARRVLRQAVKAVKKDLRRISLTHIQDIIHLVESRGKSIDLPDRIRVYKDRDLLYIRKEALPLRELGQGRKAGKRQDSKEKQDGKT